MGGDNLLPKSAKQDHNLEASLAPLPPLPARERAARDCWRALPARPIVYCHDYTHPSAFRSAAASLIRSRSRWLPNLRLP